MNEYKEFVQFIIFMIVTFIPVYVVITSSNYWILMPLWVLIIFFGGKLILTLDKPKEAKE